MSNSHLSPQSTGSLLVCLFLRKDDSELVQDSSESENASLIAELKFPIDTVFAEGLCVLKDIYNDLLDLLQKISSG